MSQTTRIPRRWKEVKETRRLLADLEANTTYHSFPRPNISELQRPSIGAAMEPTKAEKSLRDVLRAYPPLPVDHKGAAGGSSPSCTQLQNASIPPASDLTTATSVGISSPTATLGPNVTVNNRSSWFVSRPNTPAPIVRTPTPRPQSVLSAHPQPERVYTSPLDTLARTRLHIIQQEEEFRPYDIRGKRRLQRALEMMIGVVLFFGMVVGVGGLFPIGIGEGDIGGFGLRVESWRRLFGVGDGA